MKYKFLFSVLLFISGNLFAQTCPIIPLPNQFEIREGAFQLNARTAVMAGNPVFAHEATYLKEQILHFTGIAPAEKSNSFSKIILSLNTGSAMAKQGAYHLDIQKNLIRISASNTEGMFYGVVSLLQIIAKEKQKERLSIPCWDIIDSPAYQWRGIMLDESRHFFGKKMVKLILDQMAWNKLNRFHWHLTDAPGWRLQIKKYPYLTLVGGIGNYSDSLAPAQYYTQEDIREIVAYARNRHIEIIPEIDMPGHATAANRAYPEYSGGGSEKHPDFTFNPGKEATYQYLTNILKEVSVLFPSQLIHLGGDEVSFGIKGWENDAGVKKLMEKNDLKSLKDVESYFFKRMTDSSLKIFDKVLAWDEAVDGSLSAKKTVIFWWRHDKPEQLTKAFSKGYDVVLCPRIPLYFDFVQAERDGQGRRWVGNYSSLEKVYQFSGNNYVKNKEEEKHILGMQANLWTEQIKSDRRLEYMLFPRMNALAEASWTSASHRDYQKFLSRLKNELLLYRQAGIYYYNPVAPGKTPEAVDDIGR